MTTDPTVLPLQSSASAQPENFTNGKVIQEILELNELLRLIDGLPAEYRTDFYNVLDRIAASLERRHRMLGYVQESLTQMNLDLKYLIFDLEATRRERDEYRRKLESHRE